MDTLEKKIMSVVVEIIENTKRSPFLFVGSGLSRRYACTESWNDLLRYLCSLFSDDSFMYDRYASMVQTSGDFGVNPEIAKMIERDFTQAVFSNPLLREFRDSHSEDIRKGKSLLKIAVSEHLSDICAISKLEEFNLLKSLSNQLSGIITTNYDLLLDNAFPNFISYNSQDELLFNPSFNLAEIYHIHGSLSESESLVLTSDDYDEFVDKKDYLVAKLLTIFAEYPIIFLGYSLQDANILSILKSMARCLGADHLSLLKNRFIFVTYGEFDIGTHSINFDSIGSIEMTKISTLDFSPIYKAIRKAKFSFSPSVLRQLRKSVYEVAGEVSPTSKVVVSGFDGLDDISDDEQIVIGLGKLDSSRPGARVTAEMVYMDIVLDNQFLDPFLMITEHIPFLIKSNPGGLPMRKYLTAYSGTELDHRIRKCLEEHKTINQFRNNQLITSSTTYRAKNSPLSVNKVISIEGWENAYKKLVLLDENKIDTGDLKKYLTRILGQGSQILKNNSELKRLIRIYDFLKYGNAPDKSTNSG